MSSTAGGNTVGLPSDTGGAAGVGEESKEGTDGGALSAEGGTGAGRAWVESKESGAHQGPGGRMGFTTPTVASTFSARHL